MAPFLSGADGVVVSSYRLSIPFGRDNLWLETTTPSAPIRNGDIFFMAQPPLLREGGDYAGLNYYRANDTRLTIETRNRTARLGSIASAKHNLDSSAWHRRGCPRLKGADGVVAHTTSFPDAFRSILGS